MSAISRVCRVITRQIINLERSNTFNSETSQRSPLNIVEDIFSTLENSEPIKIPLGEREVVIASTRCFGEWESKIVNLPFINGDEKVTLTIWGKYGSTIVTDLERKLSFKFDSESISFIELIGNLSINHFEIIIGGNKHVDCFTATKDEGLLEKKSPLKGVKILDIGGLSYLLFENGSINAYDSCDISPDNEVFSYTSLSHLLEEKVKDCEKYPTC